MHDGDVMMIMMMIHTCTSSPTNNFFLLQSQYRIIMTTMMMVALTLTNLSVKRIDSFRNSAQLLRYDALLVVVTPPTPLLIHPLST